MCTVEDLILSGCCEECDCDPASCLSQHRCEQEIQFEEEVC